jgi:hypothetical protein
MNTCDNIYGLTSSQVTRVKLLGVGIVCGLEVFKDTQCFISVSAGVGVTSEGHVLCMPDKTLKYYREYKSTDYFNTLINCENNDPPLECKTWELLEHREEGEVFSIVPQNAADIDKPFLDGKVVLLYLEDEAAMTVRILLIDEQDMWKILKCTCILETHCIPTEPKEDEDISIFDEDQDVTIPGDEELFNAVHKKYMLNYIPIRRFGYGAVEIDDLSVGDASENLEPDFDFDSAGFFADYATIIDEALKLLGEEKDKLHNYFGCMIDACYCKEMEEAADAASPCNPAAYGGTAETGLQQHNIKFFDNYFTLINKKWSLYKEEGQPVTSIQYFYDFVKDLVNTYNELLDELYELMNECCPDTDCFPRHLMLGRIKEEISFQPSIFRQQYLQPPVYNDNANRLQQVRFLHWRMVIMMKCFYIPDWEILDLSDESYLDVLQIENEKKLEQNEKLQVRITPGRLFNEPSGRRTIPFYYNLSNSPYSLQYYWDYASTKNNREDHQLSYFCKEVPGYSNLDFVVHPFLYSLDQYPFYRIEGHTGMKATDAETVLKNLRRRYAISFQILSVTFENLRELFSSDDNEIAAYGLEHVGGVQKGYTFILLHDGSDAEPGTIIGDFQVPFMIVKTGSPSPQPSPAPQPLPTPTPAPAPVGDKEKAAKEWRASLEKINARITRSKTGLAEMKTIPAETIAALNKIQLEFVEQLALVSAQDIETINILLDKPVKELETHVKEANAFLDKRKIPGDKDDFKVIKGIGEKTEGLFHKAGITTYAQLAKFTAADIPDLASKMGVKNASIKAEWFEVAAKLAGSK